MNGITILAPLKDAGFALHWLHPRSKRPIGDGWSDAPIAALAELQATHQPANNLGVRLGLPSQLVDGSFLHVLDIDIRVPELEDEAWLALSDLMPNIDIPNFPIVISGSGGASRHIYFTTSKPFFSRKLAVSEGKHRTADGVWHYDWEIELFGTGKQVAMPPSIHPDTGKPYVWKREFDFEMLALGLGPIIAADRLEKIATAQAETYEFETRDPLTFKDGQLEAELDELTVERIDDRDDWITLGQALHHQFGGSKVGFDLWMKASSRGSKYLVNSNLDAEHRRYRQFGRNRRQPVTMATVRQWVIDGRHERMMAEFDDIDVFDEEPKSSPQNGSIPDELEDLLGPSSPPSKEPIDDLDALVNGALADKDSDDALDWKSLLDFNEEGAIRPTLPNVSQLVANDPRLRGVLQLNEFTNEIVQRRVPSPKSSARRNAVKPILQLEGRTWQVKDTLNGELWSDDRDFDVRRILEASKTQGGYGIKISDRDLKAAITVAANKNPFHPVREYLGSLAWDGNSRIETIYIDYMGAVDCQYHRDISRLFLIAAVTRIFEPGHKFDFAIIIEGIQGKRKSTFIETLGKKWFAELDGDFHDQKQMIELMQGAWIMEIPELSGFNRGDVRSIKAFMSRKTDRARLAYARRAGEFPRQCVFIGSTNDREYLKDDTGGRRFWPVECTHVEIDIAKFERNVDQVWAEAVHLYRQMRAEQPYGTLPLYLVNESAQVFAAKMQEMRRVESADDGMRGQIEAWLERPYQDGGFDDIDGNGNPRMRDQTCLIEIWCECLAMDRKGYSQTQAQSLGRVMHGIAGWKTDGTFFTHTRFGRQRKWERISCETNATMAMVG